VCPTDAVHEERRVEPYEREREARRAPEPACGRTRQSCRGQAGRARDRLERPERTGDPERRERVRQQREQRPVRARHVLPQVPRVGVDGIGHDRGGAVLVRADAVNAHPAVGDVVEDVRRQERRREREDRGREHDADGDGPHRQGARTRQHEHPRDAHRREQHHDPVGRQRGPAPRQRAVHPARIAEAPAGRHEVRRAHGRSGGDAHADREQGHERPQPDRRREHPAGAVSKGRQCQRRGAHRITPRAGGPPAATAPQAVARRCAGRPPPVAAAARAAR
jgi:hypothetical protein